MTRAQRFQMFAEELSDYRESTKDTELGSAMAKFQLKLSEVTERLESIEKEETEWPQVKKLTNPQTGTVAITWDGKLHNWDGPALIPDGNKKLAEYHLYGIPYSLEDWKEMKKQWEGLPWYKTPSILADAGTARN